MVQKKAKVLFWQKVSQEAGATAGFFLNAYVSICNLEAGSESQGVPETSEREFLRSANYVRS